MVRTLLLLLLLFLSLPVSATTIAIIDTGFDLDHDFLRPKILKQETDEETINPSLKTFSDWQFHDNSHLKEAVIKDQSLLQEILLYRNLKAKGHKEGLSLSEFEWFKKKRSDRAFVEQVKNFKKHTHGTFVAGVALREGENINIFPIRGLNIPVPVVAVEDNTTLTNEPSKLKDPEERFKDELKLSRDRVAKKFSKICKYLSLNGIDVVNASYGITYKNTRTRLKEKYREITGKEIDEARLQLEVNTYFEKLYQRGAKTIARYPKMLFVFSAGNSGLNNDELHHYPSRIRLPNTITVGATNGDYLASFSNYGKVNVDVGAPGVAILSLVPRIYSANGKDVYSPSSGTSMAAPYISNLAAQIINTNPKLAPADVKAIILGSGDVKEGLKEKFAAGAVANNQRAIKAALLSRDMKLGEAITLARSDLIPLEDSVSFGQPPAIPTSEASSQPSDLKIAPPDSSGPPSSALPTETPQSSDPVPSSQSAAPVPPPGAGSPPSSSPAEPPPAPAPGPGPSPSSP